ncbi:MAG: hypothetical protein IKA11_01065 [Clostridia bacterium]|nr:hypothetical protein [Clostridia bacterium]
MEILQFLLSLISKNFGGGILEPIINILKDNSFDIKKALNSLSPETLAPIVKQFMKMNENKNPTEHVGLGEGLKPIANIADKNIVYTLNRYFYDTADV